MANTEIWGFDVTPRAGLCVRPDGWQFGEQLIEGDSFSTLRLRTGQRVIESLAVEIAVTGRTLQRRYGMCWVRVRITFVGDGEPDVISGGWMEVP